MAEEYPKVFKELLEVIGQATFKKVAFGLLSTSSPIGKSQDPTERIEKPFLIRPLRNDLGMFADVFERVLPPQASITQLIPSFRRAQETITRLHIKGGILRSCINAWAAAGKNWALKVVGLGEWARQYINLNMIEAKNKGVQLGQTETVYPDPEDAEWLRNMCDEIKADLETFLSLDPGE